MATAEQLVTHLEGALQSVVPAAGGDVAVCEDLDGAASKLSLSPVRFLTCLWWEGFGEHAEAINGLTSHRFAILIHATRGFQVKREAEVWKTVPVLPKDSFLAVLELVSGILRSMRWPDGWDVDCKGLAQGSSEWIENPQQGARTRTHQLTFTLTAASPGFNAVYAVAKPSAPTPPATDPDPETDPETEPDTEPTP